MPFLPNIPQSTDQLSVSQGNILNNFTILGAISGNSNASSASINATSGFNWIYLPPQGATPPAGASFTAGNIGLYSANNSVTSQNELYINKQNQATTVQIPATASILSVNSSPGTFSSGWTYLPSGILLKWGQSAMPSGGSSGANPAIIFPTAATIPVFQGIFQIIVSQNYTAGQTTLGSNGFGVFSMSTTQFAVTWSGNNNSNAIVSYLAIGR